MTVQDWLGEDNQLGIDIWTGKYKHKDETFDGWLDRVSGGDTELKQLIVDKKFLFGGRALANRNTDNKSSNFNCYSRGFIKDDINDILQANTDIALTFKAQGGQGLSLSKIRPKGTRVGERYTSDGIIPFMRMYNTTTESISQGGSRKGALIITLDAWHKEAEDFIKIKSNDTEIQKANLSLEIDNDFMKVVKQDKEKGTLTKTEVTRQYGDNQEYTIVYEVYPSLIFDLLCEMSWNWADPACIFVDEFRNYNLMEFVDEYQIETCNPCRRIRKA